jgi:sterol 3beta-glucosyltransferase
VPLLRGMMERCYEACRDADAVLTTTTAALLGLSVAEKLGIPSYHTALQPTALSRFHTNFLLPQAPECLPGRGLYNLFSHVFVGMTLWQLWRPTLNAARQEVLGLPPLPISGPGPAFLKPSLSLDGYSSLVVPKPRDWPDNHHLTGYWFLDAAPGWRPPSDLEDFLSSGPPPVYIGFGSMHNRNAAEVTAIVLRALKGAGMRGVLLTGWGGMESFTPSDQFFPIESAPHAWLFPRMAAIVHHGGAGSTAASLRAGVPSLVVPYTSDQPYWGGRVHQIGAGPMPIARKQLTAQRLKHALRQAITNQAMRRRAEEIGRMIQSEDGVGQAVALFQQHIGASARGQAPKAARTDAA